MAAGLQPSRTLLPGASLLPASGSADYPAPDTIEPQMNLGMLTPIGMVGAIMPRPGMS